MIATVGNRHTQAIFEMACPMVARDLAPLREYLTTKGRAAMKARKRIYQDDCLESLTNFHGHMSRKLVENYHKPGWRGDTIESLRARVTEELAELDRCIANGMSYEIIAREAADVANMVMMIQDRFWK